MWSVVCWRTPENNARVFNFLVETWVYGLSVKLHEELEQSREMNSDLVPSKSLPKQQFDTPGNQMKRKQSMAGREVEKATALPPLGEECRTVAGQWCPGWWRSVLVSLYGTAWSNENIMRTSGEASVENVMFYPFH